MSHNNRQCIERNQDRIASQLQEIASSSSETLPAIPPLDLMTSVAFLESHLGCDFNHSGDWGAPPSVSQRHTAGTHMNAARVLSNGYQVCNSWEGSVLRFHTGLCDPMTQTSNVPLRVRGVEYLRTVSRIQRRIRLHVIRQEYPTLIIRNPF